MDSQEILRTIYQEQLDLTLESLPKEGEVSFSDFLTEWDRVEKEETEKALGVIRQLLELH